jgi:tRNA-uridine 2-sulfurtransferase
MSMMSGGVDSSVATALLVAAGHDVTGVTLKLWGGESDSGCCSVSDVEDARRVAAQLGVPHYVFNFTDEFERNVVGPYADAYAHGRTPNPCVECNRTMKFGRLLARAVQLGYDAVASGHHARVVRHGDAYAVARGADRAKDQSYVLYMLDQQQLRRTLLPVGELTKAEVRDRAAALGLRTAAKAESMDVCFITRGGRETFLGARIERRHGAIVDHDGTTLGRHDGIDAFTIGQRRGLAVATGARRYVTDIAPETGTVTIGTRQDLLRNRVAIDEPVWANGRPPEGGVSVQWRAHGPAVPGRLAGRAVQFDAPQARVAPGQAVVLYDGDTVLGGGVAAGEALIAR